MLLTGYGILEDRRLAFISNLKKHGLIQCQEALNSFDTFLRSGAAENMLLAAEKVHPRQYWQSDYITDIYDAMLRTLFEPIKKKLNLKHNKISPFIESFRVVCLLHMHEIADYIYYANTVYNQEKQRATTILYGNNFADKYPELVNLLVFCDPDFATLTQSSAITLTTQYYDNQYHKEITAHFQFFDELKAKYDPEKNYSQIFKSKTGLSVTEFKQKVREKKLLSFLNRESKDFKTHFKTMRELKENIPEYTPHTGGILSA